ncbi:MAG: glycerophosphodiester phosphodiesterase family protein [Candidatus Hydrogenedens sp.]|nr:glycerophosphodiester phosphodiesterase family protein [Candidatus Hydrogenedens sp.]
MNTLAFSPDDIIHQAHRGGTLEVPENTMAAFRHSWSLGAAAEVDICSTLDREIICIHDNTLKRTTNATRNQDVPVSELTFKEIRQWDAGSWFSEEFAGEKIPSLEEVLKEMMTWDNAKIYLDLKEVDLKQLAFLIQRYNAVERITFCHNKVENCRTMAEAVPGLHTMLWIGGSVEAIQEKFHAIEAEGFAGLDNVLLHLHKDKAIEDKVIYPLPDAFMLEALKKTAAKNVNLEVMLFDFDCDSVSHLIDLGIRWYASDEPKRFLDCVSAKADAN